MNRAQRASKPSQVNAIKILQEARANGDPMTVKEAMIRAGYSPKSNPHTLVRSKLFKDMFPDKMLHDRHMDILNLKKLDYLTFPKDMSDEEIKGHMEANGLDLITVRTSDKAKMGFYTLLDGAVVSKALDMAYKVKGHYAPEKSISVNFQVNEEAKFKARSAIREMLTGTRNDDDTN